MAIIKDNLSAAFAPDTMNEIQIYSGTNLDTITEFSKEGTPAKEIHKAAQRIVREAGYSDKGLTLKNDRSSAGFPRALTFQFDTALGLPTAHKHIATTTEKIPSCPSGEDQSEHTAKIAAASRFLQALGLTPTADLFARTKVELREGDNNEQKLYSVRFLHDHWGDEPACSIVAYLDNAAGKNKEETLEHIP